MAISEDAKDITNRLYKAYGTGTGILFGIPSNLRSAVEAIVQCVLDMITD